MQIVLVVDLVLSNKESQVQMLSFCLNKKIITASKYTPSDWLAPSMMSYLEQQFTKDIYTYILLHLFFR